MDSVYPSDGQTYHFDPKKFPDLLSGCVIFNREPHGSITSFLALNLAESEFQ